MEEQSLHNLVYHYQPVFYNKKDGIYLHEAFSTRLGELYSVNPVPVEINGDTEEEVEEILKAMEVDSTKYRQVKVSDIVKEMERWVDEVDISTETVIPHFEDEEELELDYYDDKGEVIDICDYIEKNR